MNKIRLREPQSRKVLRQERIALRFLRKLCVFAVTTVKEILFFSLFNL
jgi:nicotinate-nucleotide pyrophosphorylase